MTDIYKHSINMLKPKQTWLKTISDMTIFFLDPKEKERDNKRKLRYRRQRQKTSISLKIIEKRTEILDLIKQNSLLQRCVNLQIQPTNFTERL